MDGLEQELAWFARVVDDRMRRYLRTGEPPTDVKGAIHRELVKEGKGA